MPSSCGSPSGYRCLGDGNGCVIAGSSPLGLSDSGRGNATAVLASSGLFGDELSDARGFINCSGGDSRSVNSCSGSGLGGEVDGGCTARVSALSGVGGDVASAR